MYAFKCFLCHLANNAIILTYRRKYYWSAHWRVRIAASWRIESFV